ncbi:MAG: transcription termination factor NusA [Clostridiales bacterium]|jgi:N utilization substance protein A|nr:transcription termination factor NusA [Clostridiales bacterium]
MGAELIHALEQLEKEKGVNKDVLIEAIEAALISAYKRNFGSMQEVRISFDKATGDVHVFSQKRVVENPDDTQSEISLEQAKKIDVSLEIDDIAETEVTPRKFGRIAAQTAKQVVVQRIREAERGIIFDAFVNREDDIITGIVNRFERKSVILDIGKAEAVLPDKEQTHNEEYRYNDRIKTYITEVRKTPKGPQIIVSRTHPGLVKRLFELEVPEISDGTVEIRSISREAGSRTKIAVFSRDDNVDPVGACVGQKGTRVQAIVDELRGEKIDIIKWSGNPVEFLSSSLSPAKVVRVDLTEEDKIAEITVPDFQLSLAIGKEGQNARLAAKLTGWKIDIRSESQLRELIERQLYHTDGNYNYADEEDDEDEDGEYVDDEIYDDETYDDQEYDEGGELNDGGEGYEDGEGAEAGADGDLGEYAQAGQDAGEYIGNGVDADASEYAQAGQDASSDAGAEANQDAGAEADAGTRPE